MSSYTTAPRRSTGLFWRLQGLGGTPESAPSKGPDSVLSFRERFKSVVGRANVDAYLHELDLSVASLSSYARSRGETADLFLTSVPVSLLRKDEEWDRDERRTEWVARAIFAVVIVAVIVLTGANPLLALLWLAADLFFGSMLARLFAGRDRLPTGLETIEAPQPAVHAFHGGHVSWFWTGDKQIRTLRLERGMDARLSETDLSIWRGDEQLVNVRFPIAVDRDLQDVEDKLQRVKAEIGGAWA